MSNIHAYPVVEMKRHDFTWKNFGPLSFRSSTETKSCVLLDLDGFPLSVRGKNEKIRIFVMHGRLGFISRLWKSWRCCNKSFSTSIMGFRLIYLGRLSPRINQRWSLRSLAARFLLRGQIQYYPRTPSSKSCPFVSALSISQWKLHNFWPNIRNNN